MVGWARRKDRQASAGGRRMTSGLGPDASAVSAAGDIAEGAGTLASPPAARRPDPSTRTATGGGLYYRGIPDQEVPVGPGGGPAGDECVGRAVLPRHACDDTRLVGLVAVHALTASITSGWDRGTIPVCPQNRAAQKGQNFPRQPPPGTNAHKSR